jgi:hypothetical protein
MTDELKTAETDVKSYVAKLKDDEIAAMGWVKAHVLYLSVFGALVAGLVVGHFLK